MSKLPHLGAATGRKFTSKYYQLCVFTAMRLCCLKYFLADLFWRKKYRNWCNQDAVNGDFRTDTQRKKYCQTMEKRRLSRWGQYDVAL